MGCMDGDKQGIFVKDLMEYKKMGIILKGYEWNTLLYDYDEYLLFPDGSDLDVEYIKDKFLSLPSPCLKDKFIDHFHNIILLLKRNIRR